jgi:hypothetical protein
MKTKAKLLQLLLLGLFAMATASVVADDVKINLSGDREVPPVTTMAAGSGVIKINKDMSVSGSVTTTGIAGTMAHIHVGKAGVNGPVAVTLLKNGDNGWTVPPDAKLTDAQYQAYRAGDLYINVHTEAHKGGEIRGQLPAPPATMPTPGY